MKLAKHHYQKIGAALQIGDRDTAMRHLGHLMKALQRPKADAAVVIPPPTDADAEPDPNDPTEPGEAEDPSPQNPAGSPLAEFLAKARARLSPSVRLK